MPERKSSKRRLIADHLAKHAGDTVRVLCEGQLIGKQYRIIERIGVGGMGVLYKATDEALDRLVAIKALPPEVACDEAAVIRLKKEALSVIKLSHPNIVSLYQFVVEDNSGYLIMEYLDGPDLNKALAIEERFSIEETLAVARQIGSALDYAHKRGIIHRDIKPANLLYTTEADIKVVKIADFGIAYQLRRSITRLTGQDTSGGTMHYMPPEQMAGKKATERSDQYALAVTLYELLSGDVPFTGDGVVLINQINSVSPAPIEDVPEHINKTLLKALSKDPADRFESCSKLVESLEDKPQVLIPKDSVVAEKNKAIEKEPAVEQAAVAQNDTSHRDDVDFRFEDGWTSLMYAARDGELPTVQSLIRGGADVNLQKEDGGTALMLAASHGHKDVAECLISGGADVNLQKEDGWTALMFASQKGHKDIEELLIKHGAKGHNNDTF
jgi:serine/threonine protein kinase